MFEKEAKVWAEAVLDTFRDFPSFKLAFLEHFWGPTRQMEVRLLLEMGRYKPSDGSLVNYFLSLVSKGRFLNPPYPEPLLVVVIARHFSPQIAAALIGAQSTNDAVARLRQADYVFRPTVNTENREPRRDFRYNKTNNNYNAHSTEPRKVSAVSFEETEFDHSEN